MKVDVAFGRNYNEKSKKTRMKKAKNQEEQL